MYTVTTALKKLSKLKKRIRGVQGGTSASKTISILQLLIDKSQRDTSPKLTSVTSESFPHLKKGAIRDFLNIMEEHNYFNDKRWNKTDYIYTFETGSKIEFFSVDQPGKVKGPRRDRLFVNEGNNIKKETFEQLEVRTREEIWVDWNPDVEFWFHEDYLDPIDLAKAKGEASNGTHDPSYNVDFEVLTYRDNEGLEPSIIQTIELKQKNKRWWRVYGQGLIGDIEGKIYKDWQIIDEVPHEARLERRGLDFGYSNDPACIVDIYYYNGGFILDEQLYRTGMKNNDLAAFISNLPDPNTLVIADSAEPKSIEEIKLANVNIIGVEKKGFGNKSYNRAMIDYIQSRRISITKRSVNGIKEYRKYMFMTDRDGKVLNEPEGGNDHFMDAVKYGFDGLRPKNQPDEDDVFIPDWIRQRTGNSYGGI